MSLPIESFVLETERKRIDFFMNVKESDGGGGTKNVRKAVYLQELDQPTQDAWINYTDKLTIDAQKSNTPLDNDGYRARYIHKCLFLADTNQPFPLQVIVAWPATPIATLYDMCLDLNGQTRQAIEQAKKPLPAKDSAGSA